MWQKRPRELPHRLRFEIQGMTHNRHYLYIVWISAHFSCIVDYYTYIKYAKVILHIHQICKYQICNRLHILSRSLRTFPVLGNIVHIYQICKCYMILYICQILYKFIHISNMKISNRLFRSLLTFFFIVFTPPTPPLHSQMA